MKWACTFEEPSLPNRRLSQLPPLALEIAFRLLLACATLCSLSWLSS